MLRIALALGLGVFVIALSSSNFDVRAEDKKDAPKKLEGTLTCTKCALKETTACGHALIVKQGGKEVKYYLNDKGAKESYHSACCTADVKATVSGKIVEKDKKLTIDEPKVEIAK